MGVRGCGLQRDHRFTVSLAEVLQKKLAPMYQVTNHTMQVYLQEQHAGQY